MLLDKTALARQALQSGPSAGLSLQERRILIITDGKRSLNEVMALLGPDILPVIDGLLRRGYINDGRPPAPAATAQASPAQGLGRALGGLIRAATESVQARTEQIRASAVSMHEQPAASSETSPATPAQHASAQVVTARNGQRRSLVAAKLYMVDMLQLQRHPDAVDVKTRIQFTSGDAPLLEAIFDGMRVLQRLTNDSYGQRIVTRLGEVLPEDMLPQLGVASAAFQAGTFVEESAARPQLKVVGG